MPKLALIRLFQALFPCRLWVSATKFSPRASCLDLEWRMIYDCLLSLSSCLVSHRHSLNGKSAFNYSVLFDEWPMEGNLRTKYLNQSINQSTEDRQSPIWVVVTWLFSQSRAINQSGSPFNSHCTELVPISTLYYLFYRIYGTVQWSL